MNGMMKYMQDDMEDHAAPEKTERDDEKTALIPASLCPDLQPGDEITLQIVAAHQDEYQVKYLDHESESDEETSESEQESEQPSMAQASEDNMNSSFMD